LGGRRGVQGFVEQSRRGRERGDRHADRRGYTCAGGATSGFNLSECVAETEDGLVGNPAECPVSQEETCLKEAAALPCADAGGPQVATAITACEPCFPPNINNLDASGVSPVDVDAQ